MQKFLWVLFLLSTTSVQAQTLSEAQKEAIRKTLYQHASDETPGLALGIVQNGKVVYTHYLGYSNLENQTKVDQDTRFNIASNSKQFTALCILKLVQEGKIGLEDDIRKYLPNLYKNTKAKITVSNLINHTSGIRDYCELYALTGKTWWKQFIDNGDAMELLEKQKDLNFLPGSQYLYSNSNYIILTEIVKHVTAQDFSVYAKSLFEALGMPNSSFLTHYGEIIPHRARPYGNWNTWRDEPTITEVHGDGALYTTLTDQLQWEQIIQLNNGKYLPQAFIDKSQSPLENASEPGYGYGLMFQTNRGLDVSYHDGVTGAYNATFLRFPQKSTSIVVMSNNRSVPANYLAWQVANLVMDREQGLSPYPGNPEKIEKLKNTQALVGMYQEEGHDASIIKITEKDGSLYREMYQREPIKLIKEQGGLFEYETIPGLKINFTHLGTPNQQFTLYKSTQKPRTFYKNNPVSLSNFDKQALNGRFYNEETGTEIILKYVEGDTYTLTKNGRARKAKLILADYIRMMSTYHIKIIRDETHQVIGLNVNNTRIKQVIFKKM